MVGRYWLRDVGISAPITLRRTEREATTTATASSAVGSPRLLAETADDYEALLLSQCRSPAAPQHLLNFLPLQQGQGSLRPTLGCIDLATSR